MHTYLECVPCFLRQAVEVTEMLGLDDRLREEVVRQVLMATAKMDFGMTTPAAMGQRIHHLIRDLSGRHDPYWQIKRHSNEVALAMQESLRARVQASADPFATAVRLALAGNMIDFGVDCHADVSSQAIERTIAEAMVAPIDRERMERFRQDVRQARLLLYVCDNAGEIVFDRLLIEQMGPDRTTVVVRGGPILNDATMEDAVAAGLDSIVPVMTAGSDAPGLIVKQAGSDLRTALDAADLLVAKGQGNFETLSELERPLYFLLKVKCSVVAAHIGCPRGSYALLSREDFASIGRLSA